MSALSRLSPAELERLSAYADGELTPQEADRLRARLDQDTALRQALAEIRQTSSLLRSLPALKPPRPFTLSAERASAARRYPRLQLATVAAGLAFFLVLGADVVTGAVGMSAPSFQAARELDAGLPPADQLPAAELEQPAPAEELQQLAPEASEAPAAEPLASGAAGTPETLEQAAAPPPTGTSPAPADQVQGAAEAQPAATEAGAYRAAQAATPSTTELAAQELRAAEEAAAGDELAAAAEPAAELQNEAARARATGGIAGLALRLVEVGLGSAAAVLAVLTVRARRQS